MTDQKLDLTTARARVAGSVGKPAWDVRSGLGSFLTLSFGAPLPSGDGEQPHGEWYLWAYDCAWRIDAADGPVVGSEDDRSRIREAVGVLEGRALESFDVAESLEATLRFDGGVFLRLFPIRVEDAEHWLLWQPSGDVLVAGPRNLLTERPASAQPDTADG